MSKSINQKIKIREDDIYIINKLSNFMVYDKIRNKFNDMWDIVLYGTALNVNSEIQKERRK